MNKLREKFEEIPNLGLFKDDNGYCSENGYVLHDQITKLEQITDDFTVRFFKWCNVAKYEFPNEMSLEEKLKYFKNNIYK